MHSNQILNLHVMRLAVSNSTRWESVEFPTDALTSVIAGMFTTLLQKLESDIDSKDQQYMPILVMGKEAWRTESTGLLPFVTLCSAEDVAAGFVATNTGGIPILSDAAFSRTDSKRSWLDADTVYAVVLSKSGAMSYSFKPSMTSSAQAAVNDGIMRTMAAITCSDVDTQLRPRAFVSESLERLHNAGYDLSSMCVGCGSEVPPFNVPEGVRCVTDKDRDEGPLLDPKRAYVAGLKGGMVQEVDSYVVVS